MSQWRFEVASECAYIVYIDGPISPDINRQISSLCDLIASRLAAIVVDVVPSYSSIQITYDLHKISARDLATALRHLQNEPLTIKPSENQRTRLIPVCYDERLGPDLARVAQHTKRSIDEVIRRHSETHYNAYAVGFSPGFAYLGLLDSCLATPRLKTPRPSVAKGSVAIADRQTAIYPSESPGGWNIIGRTPIEMFDLYTEPYSLIQPNDGVQFIPIDLETYNALLKDTTQWSTERGLNG